MSSRANEYSTLEEHLESLRSPTLPRSVPNFDSSDTPPPLVDAPSDYESSETDLELRDSHPTPRRCSRAQPQLPTCDTQLLQRLGLIYHPKSTPLDGDSPSSTSSKYFQNVVPPSADEQPPMITGNHLEDVSNTSNTPSNHPPLTNSRRASEKLNDAITFVPSSTHLTQSYYDYSSAETRGRFDKHDYPSKRQIRVSITSLATDDTSETFEVSGLSLGGSPEDRRLDIRPAAPKLMLPSLRIDKSHSQSPRSLTPHDHSSVIQSPTFAKFAITPVDGHPSQILPRIQDNPSPASTQTVSSAYRQTLPSLETALKSVTDSNGMPYIDPSPSLARPPPTPLIPNYGPSPSTYSHSSPTITMSPPRLPTNQSSWRTSSHNSSNSNMSEQVSAHGSNNGSTPASSLPGQSPGNSMATPYYAGSDHDSVADSEHGISGIDGMDQADYSGGSINGSSGQGYPCTWPGCTAPPFQTQYLLNSHTNVHSNTRPHFCPVKDCPRGPGGQGFKRKNEMIRHGLVHQSPGYVCPFCPDQQHKYPRPDNLQRHVRVHHVEKDRDDPMLREVLAQRPEGGNRGRRRRLGG